MCIYHMTEERWVFWSSLWDFWRATAARRLQAQGGAQVRQHILSGAEWVFWGSLPVHPWAFHTVFTLPSTLLPCAPFGLWLIVRFFLLFLWNVNTNSYSSALDTVHSSVQNKTVISERHSACFAKRLRANLSSEAYEWHYSEFTGTYYSDSGAMAKAELVGRSPRKSVFYYY